MGRALVEACTSNKNLGQLSVESAISPTQAAAIFASYPVVDFVARVAMVQHSSGMQCAVGTVVGLLENPSDTSGPRIASLFVDTSQEGFWGEDSHDVGMYSLASALASHKALHDLTFTCPDVLAASVVSRPCAACVGLTSLTFKDCRMDQGYVPGLGKLLRTATSLSALVITNASPLFDDDADGDSSVVEPLRLGLASSRTLSRLVLHCGLCIVPQCFARLLASLVAHLSLTTCDFLGELYQYMNLNLAEEIFLPPACPQLGQVLADIVMACASPDVPLRSLRVPVIGKGEAAPEVELAPLFRTLLASTACSPSNGLTSLDIVVASAPSVAFVAD